MQKNIFITGGCGYKGSKIVPLLLSFGHRVTVFDTIWFGNFLPKHPNLKIIRGDIRNLNDISLAGFDGYGKNHKLQIQMNDTIKLIQNKYKNLKLHSITKTQYRLR